VEFRLNADVSDAVFNAGADLPSLDDFWSRRIVSGFQPLQGEDGDPARDGWTFGLTNSIRSVVYLETIRDYLYYRGMPGSLAVGIESVVAHELGHGPDGLNGPRDHGEGGGIGIMDSEANLDGNPPALMDFAEATIRRFRRTVRWNP
jgi:hypothetical protein